MGVRNKFSAVCAVAANKGIGAPQHRCYCVRQLNSHGERHQIDGFSLSKQMYGLRYMSVIGDGDSAVIVTIPQAVPYGIFVSKIDCANHFHVPEIL